MILTQDSMANDEIKAEYASSLADLTFNSKPLINMLTILAEENIERAQSVVAAIEEHLTKVQTDVKLPILYLVDCIAKNIGGTYTQLFSHNIVMTFCSVFKMVDEKTRAEMFKLRQTWNEIFPQMKLYAIDVQISMLDPAWPVTAQPPSSSIHLNPKFLKKQKNESGGVPRMESEETAPAADPETFAMQQQLIQKQKELIELQQQKLELELLQTKVKLQKQLKGAPKNVGGNVPPRSQNILLKPEVANQLLPRARDGQKFKSNLGPRGPVGSGATPRIAPVNSALLAASSRPTRDPRLQRQQAEKSSNNTTGTNSSSSVSLGSKTTILDSNNKVVTNTKSVRDSRTEPRLVTNKDTHPLSLQKPQNDNIKLKTFNQKSRIAVKNQPRSNKGSTDSLVSVDSKNVSSSASLKSSSSSSSISLLDSPTKSPSSKGEAKSPSKSPSGRHKKKEEKKFKDSSKRDRDSGISKSHKNETSPTAFKGHKGSKNRNYVRRNRSPTYSPEPNQDVDLRVPPEKLARLQGDDDKNKPTTSQQPDGMDVDLRHLPAVVSKKRPSTETVEQPAKKTKNAMFDVLFGNEDTDLRTVLPAAGGQPERPPTPPPPIISSIEKEQEKESPKKISNLDAIRAKLANATGRDRIMAQSFRKKRVQPAEDEDLRILPSPRSANDSLQKIIISPDDEQCIKTGNMTKEQEKQLMTKIIAQIEHQKLKEAQQKDKEESLENLQPVSDEELDFPEEREEKFGDKDDRVSFPKYQREMRPDSRRGAAGPFWRGGTKRMRHWDNPHVPPPAHARPGSRPPWHSHQMNPWRPIGPNFNNVNSTNPNNIRHQVDYENSQEDGKKSPEVNDLVVDSVNQDGIKTINIDGVPRDIRYYDETAVVFMNWDDPKEISFQNGTRRVTFDDKELYFLSFNDPYKDLTIQGAQHKVRLGSPSREIFIDGKPYECYFGGPGITIDLGGQMTVVKLDGPPPHVKIGTVKRTDLVAGKVNLIIDAKILVAVFLDAKLQKFVIDGETHTLKFVDALKTVLINDVPFRVEFGGLPKPITVHDKKHFIRFSVLPRGVKPGFVRIKDMEGVQVEEDSQDVAPAGYDINEPALPVFAQRNRKTDDEMDRNSNSPHFFQSFMQQNNLDLLSSVMTSSIAPAGSSDGYQVENVAPPPEIHNTKSQESNNIIKPTPVLPATVNINELFQKLVATGIVATKEPIDSNVNNKPPIRRNVLENLHKPVTFNDPKTLKRRQDLLYDALYSGMQCSSCGMRFPPEQSILYSQHLDWHFRQNRKGKKNIRVAASRRWYYSLSDWKNYEEIEDLEEREKNYFDQQQSQAEGAVEDNEEDIEIPSVPADHEIRDAHCEVCQDKFDHFFNEDKEEWHLRNAIRADNKTYHPFCYEDYQTSLLESVDESRDESSQEEDKTETQTQNIPGLEIILDDDDDDEELEDDLKDEVVIEESDDSNNKPSLDEVKTDEDNKEIEEDDDDVIINEVVPEKIEVDDDREYVDTIPVEYTVKIEHVDDGFMDVEEGLFNIKGGGQIKIKSEPVDPDEIPTVETPETVDDEKDDTEKAPQFVEASQPAFISSIDGNIDSLSSVPTTQAPVGGKIKFNISKPLPVITPKEPKEVSCDNSILDTIIDPSQPLPPGEEPIQLHVKPALQGVELKKLPPVKKGSELTGMCCIM